ncbi:hypothetical protein [Terriglobus tenax]|uniref:hypothetical protein n=1 Tax=Terriglobus tenax TaxID=1111115 RepID=UPI0021DFE06E|nr:hypothetical protein [Terriglobus tenax]
MTVARHCAKLMALLLLSAGSAIAASSKAFKADNASVLVPHVQQGQTLSDITYRVIALHGAGFDDRVVQMPATGTFTFQPNNDPSTIKWTFSVRMDGKTVIENVPGEYREDGRVQCVNGQCNEMTDASSPFYNPTFWGKPVGPLAPGKTWNVELKQPWELGPAGMQTITVLSVDHASGIVVLKREGEGVGPYEGKHDSTTVKKDGKVIRVDTKYGKAHWVGQAVFQHGITVSDELLTITPVEVSSPEIGTVHGEERQYMSLLQHPNPIPVSMTVDSSVDVLR